MATSGRLAWARTNGVVRAIGIEFDVVIVNWGRTDKHTIGMAAACNTQAANITGT